jgi:hypothetical protein
VLKLPERPKQVYEMEQRAKERKDRRDHLKSQYIEKVNKQAEEKKLAVIQAEEQRKKKILDEKEMKRQAKAEEAKKKEEERLEIEREQQRITEAREYYKRGIIIKYVLIPLAKNVEMVKDKEFFADV